MSLRFHERTIRGVRCIRITCLVFLLAVGYSAGIVARETTRYSAEIELVHSRKAYYVAYTKCNCTQTYETPYKTYVTDKTQAREEYPNGLSRVWISNLKPNCNYSCIVVQNDDSGNKLLSHTTFTTKYDRKLIKYMCNMMY